VYVTAPVVCVTGGIQPDRLRDLQVEAAADDGFLDRFLITWPDASPPRWTEAEVSGETTRAARALFRRLRPDDVLRREPRSVSLSPEAKDRWISWHDENVEGLDNATGLARGFASKLPRSLLRLCLILHALWHPDDPTQTVDAQTMEDAIDLAEYFRAHHTRFTAGIGQPGSTRPAGTSGRLLRRLEQIKGDGWVSRSDLLRGLGNVAAEDFDRAATRLIESTLAECRTVATETKPREEWRAMRTGDREGAA
jgi:hypothetical protein